MDYGVQLYGFAKPFRKNPDQFLQQLAKTGCAAIEPCVKPKSTPHAAAEADPFWSLDELKTYAALAKSHGLRIDSCHWMGDAAAHVEAVKRMVDAFGMKHVMLNGPESGHAAALPAYTEGLRSLAAGLRGSGAGLCVHNGAAEIRERIGSQSFLEAVLERCGGEVGAQLDVGWALYGGEDPLPFMKKLTPYLWSLHYKDMKRNYRSLPASETHICLGEGCLDVEGIFAYATSLGIPQLIDQDDSDGDMLEDLAKSVALLRSLEQ